MISKLMEDNNYLRTSNDPITVFLKIKFGLSLDYIWFYYSIKSEDEILN